MNNYSKVSVVGLLMLINTVIFAQSSGDCDNIRCVPVTLKVIKENGNTDTPVIVLPNPTLNIPSGQYPYGTVIAFQTPISLNVSQANAEPLLTEFKWDYESDWTTSTQTSLKNSGILSVRSRMGPNTSDIKQYTFDLYYTKVLLVGNSITQHGPFADIDWKGNWGMAASAADKDYKSILERYLNIKRPNTSFKIFPTARIENDFNNYDFNFAQEIFGDAFKESDLIVIRLGENNKDWEIPGSQYKSIMERYIKMIKQKSRCEGCCSPVLLERLPEYKRHFKTNS
ncbi:MAG: hypothetical protein R2822_14340 [Spirosomataceae bacterium]